MPRLQDFHMMPLVAKENVAKRSNRHLRFVRNPAVRPGGLIEASEQADGCLAQVVKFVDEFGPRPGIEIDAAHKGFLIKSRHRSDAASGDPESPKAEDTFRIRNMP